MESALRTLALTPTCPGWFSRPFLSFSPFVLVTPQRAEGNYKEGEGSLEHWTRGGRQVVGAATLRPPSPCFLGLGLGALLGHRPELLPALFPNPTVPVLSSLSDLQV